MSVSEIIKQVKITLPKIATTFLKYAPHGELQIYTKDNVLCLEVMGEDKAQLYSLYIPAPTDTIKPVSCVWRGFSLPENTETLIQYGKEQNNIQFKLDDYIYLEPDLTTATQLYVPEIMKGTEEIISMNLTKEELLQLLSEELKIYRKPRDRYIITQGSNDKLIKEFTAVPLEHIDPPETDCFIYLDIFLKKLVAMIKHLPTATSFKFIVRGQPQTLKKIIGPIHIKIQAEEYTFQAVIAPKLD